MRMRIPTPRLRRPGRRTPAALALAAAALGAAVLATSGGPTLLNQLSTASHSPLSHSLLPRIASASAGSAGNQYWTGYVAVAEPNTSFHSVAAQFKVPTVKCTSSGSKASFWVGLDGFGGKTVEQAGLSTDCDFGQPVYEAWYEMFPRSTDYQFYVDPGDSITVSVSYNSRNRVYDLKLTDTTLNRHFDQPAVCPRGSSCPNTTAEAVLEADNGTNLSKFTPVTFTNCAITRSDGARGAFQNGSPWSLAVPLMTGSNGRSLANVSNTWNHGSNFSITYAHSS